MNNLNLNDDKIFYALCAKAINRHGGGFPSTEEEIKKHENSLSSEEKIKYDKIIKNVMARLDEALAKNEEFKVLYNSYFERIAEKAESPEMRIAARSKNMNISTELANEIENIIKDDKGKGKSS